MLTVVCISIAYSDQSMVLLLSSEGYSIERPLASGNYCKRILCFFVELHSLQEPYINIFPFSSIKNFSISAPNRGFGHTLVLVHIDQVHKDDRSEHIAVERKQLDQSSQQVGNLVTVRTNLFHSAITTD